MYRTPKTRRSLFVNGPDRQRFLQKVEKMPSGCWLWRGARTSANSHGRGGYGRMFIDGREELAHRVAYETYRGPIPPGLTIDHLCKRPACCNPQHLAVVTVRENILRGNSIFAKNARKHQCVRGHRYTPATTGKQKRGRFCRICRRQDYANYRARQKAKRTERACVS